MKIICSLALLAVLTGCSDDSWHLNTNASFDAQYYYGESGGCAVYLFKDGTWDGVVARGSRVVDKQFTTQVEAMHWVERMCPK